MRGVVLGVAVAGAMASCVVRRYTGPRLTGTCDGACAHYVECKPGHSATDGQRCRQECPGVFSDPDSLMAFESLSCKDTVEFVDGDGDAPKAATSQR
jgi:hypothetical protein